MASQLVQDIYDFNDKAGLLASGMDSFKEIAYIFEEAFEGLELAYAVNDADGNPIPLGQDGAPTARQLALSLVNSIKDNLERRGHSEAPIAPVDEVDKAIDLVVFSIGKLAKMGLSPDQIDRCFSEVSKCNMAKLSGPKDEHGKQLKPEGWTGPEEALQRILDENKKSSDAR